MPYFDQINLKILAEKFRDLSKREIILRKSFIVRDYMSESAKEYAHHGVARRLSVIAHCIEKIFTGLPPENEDVPQFKVLIDTTIYIQAFVFNVYGVLDNLAFIWVYEKGIKKPNGQPLPKGRIGLTFDKQDVRQSFSPEMQAYLDTCNDWLAYLEGFRHSLGHRIPLYIPPFTVNPAQADLYQDLENRKTAALIQHENRVDYDRLEAEQNALRRFKPWMKHSFNDPTPPVVFHAQVLADFASVEEICQKVLLELDR
ncbi:hypothetical protein MCEMSEM23_00981 [Rhabdaerophilaceae bacterium]